MRRFLLALAFSIALSWVAAPAFADGAEAAKGKGKAKAEKAKDAGGKRADQSKDEGEGQVDAAGRAGEASREAAEREARRGGDAAEEKADEADEAAREAAEDAAEVGEDAKTGKGGDRKVPPGMAKRDAHPSTGKGSEKGQEARAKQEKPWWNFWN